MTRRILGKASGAPSGIFSADDIDYINALLTGTDQGGSDPVLMNTLFRIYGSKLVFRSTGTGNPDYTIVNPSGTTARNLTIPNLAQNDTIAVLTEPQTLAGKTLTTPVIASVTSGSGTFTHNTTGTITAPNATDTLVGKATTDIFTNKSIDAATNTFSNVQLLPDKKLVGGWLPGALTSGFGIVNPGGSGGYLSAPGGQGSPANPAHEATNGKYVKFSTTAVIDQTAGMKTSVGAAIARVMNCRFKCKWRVNATTGERLYIGLTSTATTLATDDPLAATQGVMIGYRTTDTNYGIIHSSGSATTYTATTNVTVAKTNTSVHTVEIKATESVPKFSVSLDGTAFQDITTPIPTSTQNLFVHAYVFTTAAAARDIDFFYWYIEEDGGG